MADHTLPPDSSEFLRLLNANRVSYLTAGRYQDLADLEHLP